MASKNSTPDEVSEESEVVSEVVAEVAVEYVEVKKVTWKGKINIATDLTQDAFGHHTDVLSSDRLCRIRGFSEVFSKDEAFHRVLHLQQGEAVLVVILVHLQQWYSC